MKVLVKNTIEFDIKNGVYENEIYEVAKKCENEHGATGYNILVDGSEHWMCADQVEELDDNGLRVKVVNVNEQSYINQINNVRNGNVYNVTKTERNGYMVEINGKDVYMSNSEVELVGEEVKKENLKVVEEDVVNHPKHYTQGKIECIDAIESATVGKVGIEAFYVGNVIKYLWRYEKKNGLEDVKKCEYYLKKLIEVKEKNK